MTNIRIRQSKLSFEETYEILQKGDADFDPPLSAVLDIEKYARKLSELAYFLLLEDDNQVRGCIAYYLNEEGRFVYISHYWVDAGVQRLHYGSRMLQELVFINGDYYQEILLEVTKSNPALRFYLNNGFTIKENRTEKYLLSLLLKGETCQNHH